MAEQAQKQRERKNTGTDQEAPVKKTTEKTEEQKKREGSALETLVKDIDDVLEQDAEEFVKNYVQQGGE